MPPTAIPDRPPDDSPASFRRLQSLGRSRVRQRLRNRLVEEHLGLVRQVACRFSGQQWIRDELYAEGCLALIAAVDRFDPERGFQFSTFAAACIRNRMFRWLKREKRRGGIIPLAGETTIPDKGSISAETLEAADEFRQLKRAVARLPERERSFVTMRFGLESNRPAMSFREIGRRVALSKERVRQIVGQSLRRLKEELDSTFR